MTADEEILKLKEDVRWLTIAIMNVETFVENDCPGQIQSEIDGVREYIDEYEKKVK